MASMTATSCIICERPLPAGATTMTCGRADCLIMADRELFNPALIRPDRKAGNAPTIREERTMKKTTAATEKTSKATQATKPAQATEGKTVKGITGSVTHGLTTNIKGEVWPLVGDNLDKLQATQVIAAMRAEGYETMLRDRKVNFSVYRSPGKKAHGNKATAPAPAATAPNKADKKASAPKASAQAEPAEVMADVPRQGKPAQVISGIKLEKKGVVKVVKAAAAAASPQAQRVDATLDETAKRQQKTIGLPKAAQTNKGSKKAAALPAGVIACKACKGQGHMKNGQPSGFVSGAVPCEKCRGTGVVS
jgi:hypothetical protein